VNVASLNLGTLVVRQSIHVDPSTAQVTVISDRFPTFLFGIPMRIRRIDVSLNRPGFTVNPTSCDVMKVTATLTSTMGTKAHEASRFQVGGCAGLPFKPHLQMELTGKGSTRSGDHPTLVATLTQPVTHPAPANIHLARVKLPLSLALDPNNSRHVCPYNVAKAVHGGAVGCPKNTMVGMATADSPDLSKPLSGAIYLVQGVRFVHGHRILTLPTLLIPLRGQIALDLRAKTSADSKGRLITTFGNVPDAAVSKFVLTFTGGRKGILVITGSHENICAAPQVASGYFVAHSGKTESSKSTMSKPCG
jgi:hypothetical protein